MFDWIWDDFVHDKETERRTWILSEGMQSKFWVMLAPLRMTKIVVHKESHRKILNVLKTGKKRVFVI